MSAILIETRNIKSYNSKIFIKPKQLHFNYLFECYLISKGWNLTLKKPETSPCVSLPAFCVENRTFRMSKIVNCCFRILPCFHRISDEFNDIVMNFPKRVFSWEIARCFFWHLSRLLAKTEDLRVDTCAAKSRPFLVLTFKCLSETIWRRDLLVQVNRIWLCFSLFLFLSGEFLRFV